MLTSKPYIHSFAPPLPKHLHHPDPAYSTPPPLLPLTVQPLIATMNPTANPSTPSSTSLDDADAQFLQQLTDLAKERDNILSTSSDLHASPFHHIMQQARNRLLQVIRIRDAQITNLKAAFQVECQQATDDFERGKRALRSEILSLAADRRKRVDAVRAPGILSQPLHYPLLVPLKDVIHIPLLFALRVLLTRCLRSNHVPCLCLDRL